MLGVTVLWDDCTGGVTACVSGVTACIRVQITAGLSVVCHQGEREVGLCGTAVTLAPATRCARSCLRQSVWTLCYKNYMVSLGVS